MESIKKLNGNIQDLALEEIKFVGKKIQQGKPIETVAKEIGLSRDKTIAIIEYFLRNFDANGYFKLVPEYYNRVKTKTESYYTEEEMLNGLPEYKWEDLDEYEKQFYLNYGKKVRKRHRRNDKTLE